MPTAITQRDRITASANLDISEMEGVVQVNSILLEASGFSYARPRYRNPKKMAQKNCSEIVYVLKTSFDPENLTKSGFLYQALS